MFCKKKHFHVYWTKVRWYYVGSSLTSLLDPDGQLRGHIGKWYEITASRLSVTVPQPEHDGFKQHLWVKLESWWHSASHSEAAFQCHLLCSNVQWNHSLNVKTKSCPLLLPQLQTQRQETSLCWAPADQTPHVWEFSNISISITTLHHKTQQQLVCCSENESCECEPTSTLSIHVLISVSCLRTGATLTQRVLSHKHQSCGVSCLLQLSPFTWRLWR